MLYGAVLSFGLVCFSYSIALARNKVRSSMVEEVLHNFPFVIGTRFYGRFVGKRNNRILKNF